MAPTFHKRNKLHQIYSFLTLALVPVPYEPVGRWLEACLRRQRHEKSTSISAEGSEAAVDDSDSSEDVLTEDEKGFLLSLDSKEWKVIKEAFQVFVCPNM